MTKTTPIPSPLAVLDPETRWVNSEPLTAAALRGKVVAVQFGTYSCINWIRTLPYVRAWARHVRATEGWSWSARRRRSSRSSGSSRACGGRSPRWASSTRSSSTTVRDLDRVRNRYWPALYVLDGEGSVRYQHFGEGAYEESRRAIRGCSGVDGETVHAEESSGIEAPPTGTRWAPRRRTSGRPRRAPARRRRRGAPG